MLSSVQRIGLLIHPGGADAVDGVPHGHGGPQGHILRGHDGTGGVFRVAQQIVDLLAGVGVCLGKDTLYHIGGHLLHQVHRVVHIELLDDVVQLRVGKAPDQQLLQLRVQLGKGLRRLLLGQQAENFGDADVADLLQDPRHVGRLHGDQHVLDRGILFLLQKRLNGASQGRVAFCHRSFLLLIVFCLRSEREGPGRQAEAQFMRSR